MGLMTSQSLSPAAGSVYAVSAMEGRPFLLACVTRTAQADEVEVMAITTDTAFATDREVLLDTSALGFPAVLHPDVQGAVLASQLDEQIGEVSADLLELVLHGQLDHVSAGPPSRVERDPRNRWRMEVDDCFASLWEPLRELRESSTLGVLLTRRRLASSEPAESLASAVGMTAKDLEELERDRLAVMRTVPPERLAALLRHLSIFSSSGLMAKLRFGLAQTAGPAKPIAMARRAGRPGASDLRGEIDRYVTAVAAELAGRDLES
jgi:hypothetical protein